MSNKIAFNIAQEINMENIGTTKIGDTVIKDAYSG